MHFWISSAANVLPKTFTANMEKKGEASTSSNLGEFTSHSLETRLSGELMELENIPSVVPARDEEKQVEKVKTKMEESTEVFQPLSDEADVQNHRKPKRQTFIKKSYSVPFSDDDSDDDEEENKVAPRRCVSAYPEPSLSEKVRRLLSPKAKSNRVMDARFTFNEEGHQNDFQNPEQITDGKSESETEDVERNSESQNDTYEIRGDVTISISSEEDHESTNTVEPQQTAISRFRAIANAQAACNAMMEQARQNIFLESMQCLYGILVVGYFCCLVPFKVTYQNGKYGIQSSWIRMIIITTLVSASLMFQLAYAKSKIGHVHNVKQNPEKAFDAAQQVTYGLLIMAFLYAFTMKKDKLDEMFSTFSNILPTINKFQKRAFIRILCVVAILLIILSLWMALGKDLFELGDFDFWKQALHSKAEIYFGITEPHNNMLSHLVALMMTILSFYNELIKYYIDLLMMSCAVTLYLMEKRARKYCLQEDHFDIGKTTGIFRQIKLLVHKINLAFGALTVAYNIDVVLFGVCTITSFLEIRHIAWERSIICLIKIAVIFLAAEGCANADNLVEQILTYKIRYDLEHMNRVTEFQNVSKRAICLTGMDFFDVNHPLLGTVGLAVLTYILLILEWKLDCGKDPDSNPDGVLANECSN